jgi:hypothetical protein
MPPCQPGDLVAGPLLGVTAHGSTLRASRPAANTTFLE